MNRLKQNIKDLLVYAQNIFSRRVSYKSFQQGLRDWAPPSLDEAHEKMLVSRISEAYRKAVKDGRDVPSAYRAGGAWNLSPNPMERLSELALGKDMDSLRAYLRNFLRSPAAHGVYIAIEAGNRAAKINRLSLWKDEFDFYAHGGGFAVADLALAPMFGNPACYLMDGAPIIYSAPRHKFHQSLLVPLLRKFERPLVVEIGGGFGGLASFLLSDSPVRYLDFDLPEQLMMATYYLGMSFPEAKMLLYGEQPAVLDGETLQGYDICLLPNFCIPSLGDGAADITVNFASLSEMGAQTVHEYVKQINRFTAGYFFHENSDVRAKNANDHIEVPASEFPVDEKKFRRVSFKNLGLGANMARYVHVLYEARH